MTDFFDELQNYNKFINLTILMIFILNKKALPFKIITKSILSHYWVQFRDSIRARNKFIKTGFISIKTTKSA